MGHRLGGEAQQKMGSPRANQAGRGLKGLQQMDQAPAEARSPLPQALYHTPCKGQACTSVTQLRALPQRSFLYTFTCHAKPGTLSLVHQAEATDPLHN